MIIVRCFLILLCIIALAACSTPSETYEPQLAPPNAYTRSLIPLDSSTLAKLTEISILTSSMHNGSVSAVENVLGDNKVLAAYSETGYVMGWDAATDAKLVEYMLGVVSEKALTFSASGTYLMGATGHIFKSDMSNRTVEYVSGIALWDMTNGMLVQCITYPCQSKTSGNVGFLDAMIDGTGRWAFTYSESTIGIEDLTQKSLSLIIGVNDLDASYQWNIGAIAYAPCLA